MLQFLFNSIALARTLVTFFMKGLVMDPIAAEKWIEYLNLTPHPEGGYFKESFRSSEQISQMALPSRFSGNRSFGTQIYYLLNGKDISHFHKIKQDETWHFYAGSSLVLHILKKDRSYIQQKIGLNMESLERPQFTVMAGDYFAAEVTDKNSYSLVGCSVSPGFEFEDFTMPHCDELKELFPDQRLVIDKFAKK